MKYRAAATALLLLLAPAAPARPPDAQWLAEAAAFGDELSPSQRLQIQQQLDQALTSAAVQSALPSRKADGLPRLQWPLRANPAGYFGYHGVSNFVDHDAAFPNHVRDYVCGSRTYDNAGGYNHGGTDYFIWPFPWRTMDAGDISIVAAAAGVIVLRSDGNPDRSCAMGDLPWNAVYIRHDDGSVAWYGHMKRDSVTARQPGERVEPGEYLGLVGSSGSSTGPHLHFELHDAAGRVVDPKNGACNAAPDLWQIAQPYEDPAINTLSLHAAEPQSLRCGLVDGQPVNEETYALHSVAPGQSFLAFAAFRDHRNGDISQFSILRPDGSVFTNWQYDLAEASLPRPFYAGTAWGWSQNLPADAPLGYWTFAADFHGRRYAVEFFVGSEAQARDAAVRRERAAATLLSPRRTR